MSLIKSIVFIVLIVGFSCTDGFSQDPITINIESGSGTQGSSVCIDFTVGQFLKVVTSQFIIRFDPNVVKLDTPIILSNTMLSNISIANFNDQQIADGFLNFVWFDPSTNGVTLDDNDVIFTLCFELIGDPCESTDICIVESGALTFEFLAIDCITGEDNDFPPIINKGSITIDPDGYSITTAFCSTDDVSNSGSITFAGTGGTGPYDWEVNPSGASGSGLNDCEVVTVNDLGPGVYTVTFIDANNNSISEIVTISTNSDFPFLVSLEGTNPTCFDLLNGNIIVTDIQGGEGPFVYEWSTFEFLEDTITKLGEGDYALTITDINGCMTSSEVTLAVDTLSLSYQIISDPSCEEGATDGIVSISAEGGTPFPGGNYNFEIDGIIVNNDTTNYFGGSGGIPVNPFTPGNLISGCYEVTATDNATIGCVSDPIQFCIEAGNFSTLEIIVSDISCFGECEGEVMMGLGILGNYDIRVTSPLGVVVTENNTLSFTEDNLCGGMYEVFIDDLNANCTLDTFFIIEEPDLLELTVLDSLGPGCGGGDGMITFGAIGGTPDYTYLWNDSFDQPSRMDMVGGNYSVTVTDMNGCQDSISFSFEVGGTIGLNAFVCNAVTCGGVNDGSICASVTSAGTFTFTWEDSNGLEIGTGDMINGIGGGVYFVTATDGSCTDTETVFVAPGDTPSVLIVQSDPTCVDSDDGNLTATLTSGTNPPSFEWTQPPSTAILSAGAVLLDGVGIYNLNVTDGNGCELDTLIEMTPPTNSIQIDITNIIGNTCFGECEGTATFTASGGPAGTGSYLFVVSGLASNINNGLDQVTIDTLCGGDNWVYAHDGTCPSDTFFFNIPDGDPITLNEANSVLDPPSCAGGDDGSITIEVQGGNSSSYDILWVNEGVTGPTLTGLESGPYIYNVTDGNNCVFVDTVMLAAPDSLMVSVNPFTSSEITCNDPTGDIGLLTSGGNSGSLTYTWDPVVSNTDFAGDLGPGLYSVTVMDSKGCTAETSYELTSEGDPVQAIFGMPEEPNCFGGQTCISIDTAFGGSGTNFTFTISNGGQPFPIDTCINVFASDYTVTVFDSEGCPTDTTFTINQPNEILVDIGPDVTISLGDSTGPLSTFISTPLVDSIFWDPINDLTCNTADCQIVTLSPTGTTDYTVTVVDENGCMSSDDITVFVDLARHVYFPNIFSPNGDNQNDFFQLTTGSGVVEVSYFRLFDRWGNMVHEDLDYMPDESVHPGWDGTFNNRGVEAGIYVYFAEVLFEDNVRVLFKGDVTMVR